MGVMTAVAVVGAASSAYGAMQAGKGGAASAAAYRQQAINSAIDAGRSAGAMQVHAEQVLEEGRRRADNVLSTARAFRGSQKVAAAASGFVVGQGTAEAHLSETDKLAAADALAILHSAANAGAAERVSAQAMIDSGVSRAQGFVAQADAAYKQGQASMLQGFMNAASYGFKAYQSFNKPTPQAPQIGPTPWGNTGESVSGYWG